MSSSSTSNMPEFDMEGFIVCLAAYLLGPEMVQKNLFLPATLRPQRIFWKSPLLVSAADETEEPEMTLRSEKGSSDSGNSSRMMDPVIVLLNAMFEYNPSIIKDHPTTTATSSSSSKLSLRWGGLVYNKNGYSDNNSNSINKYFYVESSHLTFHDLQLHFGVLDVPLDDLDNDITVLAKNMAMALLHIGCCHNAKNNNNSIENPSPPPPPPDGNNGTLKFPLYYSGFEMYSSIILANNLNHHVRVPAESVTNDHQKENDMSNATTTIAAGAATISPYSLGQWRAMLDACASSNEHQHQQQHHPLSDGSDEKKTTKESSKTKSTSHANNSLGGMDNDDQKAMQDDEKKNDVAVKNLLKLYNTSFRDPSSCLAAAVVGKENNDDDTAAAAAATTTTAPSPYHDTTKMAASLQPPGDDANSPSSSSSFSPAATTTSQQQQANKKKKHRRPKVGGYYEQKKAKPLGYADD